VTGRPQSKLRCMFTVRRFLAEFACTAAESQILLLLSSFAQPDGTRVIQSYDSIAGITKLDKRTVRRAVAFWIQNKILILAKPGGGRGNAATYRIDMEKVVTQPTFSETKVVTQPIFPEIKVVTEADKGGHKGGQETHPPNVPIQSLQRDKKERELASLVSSPATVIPDDIFRAFAPFRGPFGSVPFQRTWASLYDGAHSVTSDLLENQILSCKSKHIPVPGLWYAIKRELEKAEAAQMLPQNHESFQERQQRRSTESLARVIGQLRADSHES
jgi:hypothetical protein